MTRVILSGSNAIAEGCSAFDRSNRMGSRTLALRTLELLVREGETPEIRKEAAGALDRLSRDWIDG